MNYIYDKDEIKNNLTVEQVEAYLADLGAEPYLDKKCLICKTICHGGNSHKLYYYPSTHLFKCYTQCEKSSFDIFDLTERVKKRENPDYTFINAVQYVANYFGITKTSIQEDFQLEDWKYFNKAENEELPTTVINSLPIYDSNILRYLPRPIILPWIQEGISEKALKNANICFDPVTDSVIIPHYDINNNLVGIRRRTLIEEEEKYGKYIPATLNGKMYNHPLSFNLYNINLSKENIQAAQTAIVFESEKSCLMYQSYFGEENDISVACCGSNLILYQTQLLKSLNVKEIIIAFDRQWQTIGDDEYHRWTRKLTEIHNKYKDDFLISFIFDKEGQYLDYKDSPIDKNKEIFLKLFKERIYL